MITSINSIQEKVGKRISLFQIRHAIKRFECMGFLVNKSSKTGRLITICNWERYQSKDETYHNDVAQNASTSSQDSHKIVTPNKNVKKGKKGSAAYLSFEELDIQRANESFEKAKAEFLRRAVSQDVP